MVSQIFEIFIPTVWDQENTFLGQFWGVDHESGVGFEIRGNPLSLGPEQSLDHIRKCVLIAEPEKTGFFQRGV